MIVIFAAAELPVNAAQLWMLAMAAMSRAAWVLVTRAAERADRMAAEAERARRESAVAEAERAEERELANSLHDTAATTLLMVGTGQVPPVRAGWPRRPGATWPGCVPSTAEARRNGPTSWTCCVPISTPAI